MSVITKGRTFVDGEQLTAAKLNDLVDDAVFNSTAVDNSTTRVNTSGAITVKPEGITSNELAQGAVESSNLATSALEAAYPEGSIYMNADDSRDPSILLGFGTWAAFGAGRVLVGIDPSDSDFNTAEDTGGTKAPTMPSHSHSFSVDKYKADNGTGWEGYMGLKSHTPTSSQQDYGDETITTTTSSSGNSSNGNLPPYIVVYMWKRTA
jgi:hypothetical protein